MMIDRLRVLSLVMLGAVSAASAAQAGDADCRAAARGDAAAAYRVGWAHLNGRAGHPDPVLAARWLGKAAAAGDPQAGALLDRFHLVPDDVEPACPHDEDAVTAASAPAAPRAVPAPREVARMVDELAPRYGLDAQLVLAVVKVESDFRADAVSPRDARGLMQVLPATAERFAVRDPAAPRGNLIAGMKYLRWLLSYFRGDVTLALAAYNAGEGRVIEYRGVPPFPETEAYVRRVRRYYTTASHPFVPGLAAGMARFPG